MVYNTSQTYTILQALNYLKFGAMFGELVTDLDNFSLLDLQLLIDAMLDSMVHNFSYTASLSEQKLIVDSLECLNNNSALHVIEFIFENSHNTGE